MWLGCFNEESSDYCTKLNESIPNLDTIANGYLYFNTAIYGPIMLLMYIANFICIRVTLSRSAKDIEKMTSHGNDSNKRSGTVTRITKMLSLILILDVVCTLPILIQSLGLLFEPEKSIHEKGTLYFELIDVVAEIFLALRPTYNFWIYVFQRPEFRKRLKMLTRKVIYPCCHFPRCPLREFVSDGNVVKQTSSLTGNGTTSRKQSTGHLQTTSLARTTPPPRHLQIR